MTVLSAATKAPRHSAVRALESEVALRQLEVGRPDAGRVEPGVPVSFQFRWQGRRFVASMVTDAGGLSRLAVTSHVADGASAGNGGGAMIVAIATDASGTHAELKLVRGTEVMLNDRYALHAASGLSVDNLVSRLTTAVLQAAPYLDLLSETNEAA